MAYLFYYILYVLTSFLVCTAVQADTTTTTFDVTASVVNGCSLGGSGSGGTDFGTINFGTIATVSSNIDIASSIGAGSIVVTCTPGASVIISLGYGDNDGNSNFRYLNSGTTNLAYQLYRDPSYSDVWGTVEDGLAYTIAAFPDTTQTYTVYARLFSPPINPIMPAAETYTDTVMVTLIY